MKMNKPLQCTTIRINFTERILVNGNRHNRIHTVCFYEVQNKQTHIKETINKKPTEREDKYLQTLHPIKRR